MGLLADDPKKSASKQTTLAVTATRELPWLLFLRWSVALLAAITV
jgi:hypothetical protein